jgi:hypothetical protein
MHSPSGYVVPGAAGPPVPAERGTGLPDRVDAVADVSGAVDAHPNPAATSADRAVQTTTSRQAARATRRDDFEGGRVTSGERTHP